MEIMHLSRHLTRSNTSKKIRYNSTKIVTMYITHALNTFYILYDREIILNVIGGHSSVYTVQ